MLLITPRCYVSWSGIHDQGTHVPASISLDLSCWLLTGRRTVDSGYISRWRSQSGGVSAGVRGSEQASEGAIWKLNLESLELWERGEEQSLRCCAVQRLVTWCPDGEKGRGRPRQAWQKLHEIGLVWFSVCGCGEWAVLEALHPIPYRTALSAESSGAYLTWVAVLLRSARVPSFYRCWGAKWQQGLRT